MTVLLTGSLSTWWRAFAKRAARGSWSRRLAYVVGPLAILVGFATYAALTEMPPFGHSNPRTVSMLLTVDLGLLMVLAILIARRIVRIWISRRRGLAGSRLHVRLVLAFSVLAAAPAVFMAVFSAIFFYVGVQSWFSDRVRTAINESVEVAKAYLLEHQQNIAVAALSVANDLNQEAGRLMEDQSLFDWYLSKQVYIRALSEAIVFDGTTGRLLGRSGLAFSLEFDRVPTEAFEKARSGEVAIITGESEDRVRALVRLDRFIDSYLYVGRVVEPKVIAHMQAAEGAVHQYSELEHERGSLQVKFTLIFLMVAMLLLLAAVWAGLNFATRLVRPIGTLIGAAERVRAGDLTVRVPVPEAEDELSLLARAFNRMTTEIENQRYDLLEANRLMDERRRFTETVLFGVSAGVIGLDAEGRINLPNLSAARLLGVEDPEAMIGRTLADYAPDMAELLSRIPRHGGRVVQDQIQIRRVGQAPLILLVRIATEGSGGQDQRGYVVTFDDITELVSAQRKAAWADVARRIAHEIKNPLTPIQLSAERLRRKYLKQIDTDTDVFTLCTDTIIRQVDDIRRMVDEFSAFARMPQPVMKPVDLADLIRQAVFLQASAHSGQVHFDNTVPHEPLPVVCDGRQMSQALTNLLQNAVDAIEGRTGPEDGSALPLGEVRVRIERTAEAIHVVVEDNGKGLPNEERHRLTEPYVTTRAKGTGLGLAIVRKIMEDHGGEVVLNDREGGTGASVRLVIPIVETARPPVAEAEGNVVMERIEGHSGHGA
jgi:two-component system, NtrC family, nitrogen regulation sensor histidine kinase NtrY